MHHPMVRSELPDGIGEAVAGLGGNESIQAWTTLAGAILVTLGGYLPWLRYNPDYEGVALVLSPQTRPGFEGFDLVLVVPVGLLVAFLAVRGPTKWWARATALVGFVAVLLPTLAALDSYIDHNPYYVPDVGLALTVLGGVLLLVVAGYDRYTTD